MPKRNYAVEPTSRQKQQSVRELRTALRRLVESDYSHGTPTPKDIQWGMEAYAYALVDAVKG